MGAAFGKSKPITDSARSVILRRKKDLPPVTNDIIGNVTSISEPVDAMSIRKPFDMSLGSENQDFSPEMIKEMSNWGSLVKTSTLKVPFNALILTSLYKYSTSIWNQKLNEDRNYC